MQTFTIEEAAALIANKYGWHEGAQKTLVKQLLDAAKDGTLIVRHPHTDLPYRPKEHCEYYETVGVSDLNRYFEAAGAPWRLDNGGDTADRLFETEWWNLHQVLAWVYLGDRALVKQGAIVNQGADFAIQLKLEATNRQGACYTSFSAAEKALVEALQRGKLTAYGLENGEGNLKEIPSLQWADLKIWWGYRNPDHAGPHDCFRLGASRWIALRFRRKDILAQWPEPIETMADEHDPGEQKTPTTAEGTANVGRRTHNKRNTEARNRSWQERIAQLAANNPTDSHTELSRKLAKEVGVYFQTIRRNTKLGHR